MIIMSLIVYKNKILMKIVYQMWKILEMISLKIFKLNLHINFVLQNYDTIIKFYLYFSTVLYTNILIQS